MRGQINGCLLFISLGVLGATALTFTTDALAQNDTPPVAAAPAAAAPADNRAAAMAAQRERENATPDTPGTGRYPALKEEVTSLPDHVVYRPADLGKLGAHKLGV